MREFLILLFGFCLAKAIPLNRSDHALVTLVTGKDSGYVNGALALGSSYLNTNGNMSLVALVTADVPSEQISLLSKIWKVIDVDPIACNHKFGSSVNAETHNLEGKSYQAGISRWKNTCTKFRSWQLTQFKRIVFMDSDMLIVSAIDHALYGFSNASFVAAPETFPPDTFNAGFMVISPSEKTFNQLIKNNAEIGSAEGGDQGVLNNGLCPNWFTADSDDRECGRLPWIFNVGVMHYKKYETLQKMASNPSPAVIHFVSDGKPWVVLAMDYMEENPSFMSDIKDKKDEIMYAHALWRIHFFKVTGYAPPTKSVFGSEMENLFASRDTTKFSPEISEFGKSHEKYQSVDAKKIRNKQSTKKHKNRKKKSNRKQKGQRSWTSDVEEL